MNQNLNQEEREVVKLALFFQKNAKRIIEEKALDENHLELSDSCEKIITALNTHADFRASVLQQQQELQSAIQDNAVCPKCEGVEYLKHIGVDSTEEWKCNKYKCRRCNITFVWNRPNNPWDLLKFVDKLKEQLQVQMGVAQMGGLSSAEFAPMMENLDSQMANLKATIDHVDKIHAEMIEKDQTMTSLVKEFKKFLMIEKIKLEA